MSEQHFNGGGGGLVDELLVYLGREFPAVLDALARSIPAALLGVVVGAVQRTVSFNSALDRHTVVVNSRLQEIGGQVKQIREDQLVASTKAEQFRQHAGEKIEAIDDRLDRILLHYVPRPAHRRDDD